jgi:hypothetical protein
MFLYTSFIMYGARIEANPVMKKTRWARIYCSHAGVRRSDVWTGILVTLENLVHRLACKIERRIVVIWRGATLERHLPYALRV